MKKHATAQHVGSRILRRIGKTILCALLATVFAFVIIITTPEENENAILPDQPLFPASPSVTISNASELDRLLAAFPVPVLCCLQSAGMSLISGTAYDAAFEDGFARVAEVRYALPDGKELLLTSIYPARASSLLERDGYALIDSTELAGMQAVRMSREDSIRIHAQHSEAFYVLTAPAMSLGELSGLTAEIQRMGLTQ